MQWGHPQPRSGEGDEAMRRSGAMTSRTGERSTRQRAAIASLLDTLDDFRSAQELHDELRRRGENIGLTTVYRTLQSMSAAGLLDTPRPDARGAGSTRG